MKSRVSGKSLVITICLALSPLTIVDCPFFNSPWILLSNASVAFLLNIAAVFLVGAGSGLVLTLAGVFKDILLITGSVLIFGSSIAPLQVFGASLRHYSQVTDHSCGFF